MSFAGFLFVGNCEHTSTFYASCQLSDLGHDATRKIPFQYPKESRRGKSQKNKAKGLFLVGRAGVSRPQASGLSFRHCVGNRFELGRKKTPNSDFFQILRPFGRFFLGFGEAKPRDFRGDMGDWVRREPHFFVTAASGGVRGKMEEQPIHYVDCYFLAFR